jgi:hypothetical protein
VLKCQLAKSDNQPLMKVVTWHPRVSSLWYASERESVSRWNIKCAFCGSLRWSIKLSAGGIFIQGKPERLVKRGQRQIGRLVTTHHIAAGVFHANKPLASITPASRVRVCAETRRGNSSRVTRDQFLCASHTIHFGREAFLIWCELWFAQIFRQTWRVKLN